jgi:hypothetical protein
VSYWDDLAKQAKAANPVGPSGRLGGVLPPTQKQQQTSESDVQGPVYGALSNILSTANVPGGAAGAFLRDVAAHKPLGFGQPPSSNTAETHFGNMLMGSGKSPAAGPAAAVNEYFATSPSSMKAYSKSPPGHLQSIGEHFTKQPPQGAALDFVGRILDPGNALTFETVGGLSDLLKGTTRVAARAAAKAIIKKAPEMAGSPLVRHLNSAENLATGNRFGEIRSAAEDIARSKGWNPKAVKTHGEAAEVASRNIANAGKFAKGADDPIFIGSQPAANGVFKGLTKDEDTEVIHMIDGDSPLMGDISKLSPAQKVMREKLMPRVEYYRTQVRPRLDAATTKYQVADAGRLQRGDNFFSRAGMFVDPENELGEEALPQDEAFRQEFGGGVGTGPRRGTLGENIHRKYATLRQALRNGVQRRPDVSGMRALEMHAFTRTRAARINQQLDKLQELGLIIPKNEPVPLAIGVTKPVPQPPGYLDFGKLGSMRQFGSNITRDAWVHPSIPALIEDITLTNRSRGGLSSVINAVGAAGRVANRLLSTAEVSNPFWHPGFNIDENIASEAPSPMGFIRGATSKAAIHQAEEEGVHVPFARRQSAHQWGRPWSDLSPKEKALRLVRSIPHGVESFASSPLYGEGLKIGGKTIIGNIEPTMATGAYEGLKGRMGAPGANLAVRSMLGEPENLGAATQDVNPLLQFPAWTLSQLRRWAPAIAKRPYLYNAPHAAARDINAAQGRSPKLSDEGKVIPPIVLGKDKNGDFTMLNIPHPGNRLTELGTALLKGDKVGIGYALAGAANPLLQAPLWQMLQGSTGQKRALQYVAPDQTPLQGAMDYIKGFGRFAPVRGLTSKELSPWGVIGNDAQGKPIMGNRADMQKQLINAFLYGHGGRNRLRGLIELRDDQHKAEKGGDNATADAFRKAADQMYGEMVQALTSQGFQAP